MVQLNVERLAQGHALVKALVNYCIRDRING
jgi:hypothetical protein